MFVSNKRYPPRLFDAFEMHQTYKQCCKMDKINYLHTFYFCVYMGIFLLQQKKYNFIFKNF